MTQYHPQYFANVTFGQGLQHLDQPRDLLQMPSNITKACVQSQVFQTACALI